MTERIAFLLKGYPRLSETFIAQEILGLEKLGIEIEIYSLRPGRDRDVHPIHREIGAPVRYLPERLRDAPYRVARGLRRQLGHPGFKKAIRVWLEDLRRQPSLDRIRRFGQALVLANELDGSIGRLHAHFLHTPASVARYASLMTGLPWSCSAHARDIWTIRDWEKAEKLTDMEWLVTCTEAGRAHLAALAPSPDKVRRVYHGADLTRLPAPPDPRPARDGSNETGAVRLLSVGRPVEKKGFDDLLAALASLPRETNWRWIHVGDGTLLTSLKAQAGQLGLRDRIEWRGALTHDDVMALYRSCDLFVLPCKVARDGDRDGLPNVLMEAQSQALACLSTQFSAIPELIENGVTGQLVAPGDPAALAEAISELIADPARRKRLGRAGRNHLERHFSHRAGLKLLAGLFRRQGKPSVCQSAA